MQQLADSLLFSALVNELRLPLLQINRLTEIDSPALATDVSLISQQALRLVDAYGLAISQDDLALEPLNIRNVLYETAQSVMPFAGLLNFTVEVDKRTTTTPVVSNRESLRAVLALLATSLMNNPDETDSKRQLVLASHQLPNGTMVGVFSNQPMVLNQALPASRSLSGKADQAAPELGQTGSACLAIADRLGEQMSAPLKAYRHNNLVGIGSLLLPSSQLHLIV